MKFQRDWLNNPKKIATRDGFGEGLVELGEKNKEVVVLCGDLTESTRVEAFKEKFPERFFEMGVAEQGMVGAAAGLAQTGKIPFVATYAVFIPNRALDQVRISVAYNNVNVKLAGAHAGLTVGPDGATHQALEDIAIMRSLPNFIVIVPSDSEETRKATLAAAEIEGPVYLRFGRAEMPVLTLKDTPFKVGKAEVFREGKDATIVACGAMVYEAMKAAEILWKENINVTVINSHTIKPLDEETILTHAKKTRAVVTAEEHQINGGLSDVVAQTLTKNLPCPQEIVAVEDHFGQSGKPEELMVKYGLTAKNIVKKVLKAIERKNKNV